MQYNPQYFASGPPNCSQFYSCTPSYQTPPPCHTPQTHPDIIGEGEVTSIILPDGTVQLYFIPRWSPYVQNSNFNQCSPYWNPTAGAWFVRSVSNSPPCAPFLKQQCAYSRQNFNCNNDHIALPPSSGFQVKFHNDSWTSTTDLGYFCPRWHAPNLTPQSSAAVQVTTPESCCIEVVCDNPCKCGPDCRGNGPPIYNGRVVSYPPTKDDAKCRKHLSDMSIDENVLKRSRKRVDNSAYNFGSADLSADACCSETCSNASLISINRYHKSKRNELKKQEISLKKAEESYKKRKEKEQKRREKEQKKKEKEQIRQNKKHQKKLEKERLKLEKYKFKREKPQSSQSEKSSNPESDYESCSCSSGLSFASLFTGASSYTDTDKSPTQSGKELNFRKKELRKRLQKEEKMRAKEQERREKEQKRQANKEAKKLIKSKKEILRQKSHSKHREMSLQIQDSDKEACKCPSLLSVASIFFGAGSSRSSPTTIKHQELKDKNATQKSSEKELRIREKESKSQLKQEEKMRKKEQKQQEKERLKLEKQQRKSITKKYSASCCLKECSLATDSMRGVNSSSFHKDNKQIENQLNFGVETRKQTSAMSVDENTCKCTEGPMFLKFLDYIPSRRDMSSECTAPPTSNKLLATQNDQACSCISLPPFGTNFNRFPSDIVNSNQIEEKDSVELRVQTYFAESLKLKPSVTSGEFSTCVSDNDHCCKVDGCQ